MLPGLWEMKHMRTAIMTDTNSGISEAEGRSLSIHVLPMPVIVGEADYLEGVNITHPELYHAMTQGVPVRTSQPAAGDVLDFWDRLLKEYDAVIYLPMSGGLSGSTAVAQQLAGDYGDRVQVVDNRRISVTLRSSVLEAKALADRGWEPKKIRETLEQAGRESSIYIAVNSLEYLKKSGRVTPAAAAVAAVLNLKPVLTIQGDKLDAFARVRGMEAARQTMLEAVRKDLETRFAAAPRDKVRIGAAGSFREKEKAEGWLRQVREAFPDCETFYGPLSCSIACHVGADAVGIGICPRIDE